MMFFSRVRKQVVISAIAAYRKMRRDEDDGVRPLYRPRTWMESRRRLEKVSKRNSWAKVGRTPREMARAPLIISPLAGNRAIGEIKKTCQEFAMNTGIHVKVCPRGGNRLSKMVKSDPLGKGSCDDDKCMVCMTGGKGKCRKNGAGYKISCLECPKDGLVAEYEGESGRNAYSRGLEHQNSLRNENKSSPLWKHCTIQQESEI